MYEKRNDNEKRKRKENVVAKVNIKHIQMILFAFGCVIDKKSCLVENRDILYVRQNAGVEFDPRKYFVDQNCQKDVRSAKP